MRRRILVRAVLLSYLTVNLVPLASRAADAESASELAAKIEPSVVRIEVIKGDKQGVGSGYVAADDGIVATNYHVIQGATDATAVFKTGEKAAVLGTLLLDPKRDIAILKIDKQGLTPLPLADKLPQKKDSVVAFGAPVGSSSSVSEGVVSAVRDGKELSEDDSNPLLGKWIQTTAPISLGNSGGPLVNREGQVVAMNAMVLVIGQNLNFAISAPDVVDAIKRATGKKTVALADGAAKSKPNKRTAKPRIEIVAKNIPAASLESYIAAGQKNFKQSISDAHSKLREERDVLSGMKEGSTKSATSTSTQKQTDVDDYKFQMFKGKKYYHFPDSASKEKHIAEQQNVVNQNEELVKQLEDQQQGVLNYLKKGSPELKVNAVGDVGFVAELPVLLISDDDEFQSLLGSVPVLVRGTKTDKLANGSKMDNRIMFVSGRESQATKIDGVKPDVFVLREMPDEALSQYLKLSSATSAARAGTTSPAGAKPTAKGSAEAVKSTGTGTTSALAKEGDFRNWSDKSGKYKIEAQLIAKVDDKVMLKRRDNNEIMTIPIEKLSDVDQDYIKSKNAAAAK